MTAGSSSSSSPEKKRAVLSRLLKVLVVAGLIGISFLAGFAFPRPHVATFAEQVPLQYSLRTVDGNNLTLQTFSVDLSGRDSGSTNFNFSFTHPTGNTLPGDFLPFGLCPSDSIPSLPWSDQSIPTSKCEDVGNLLVWLIWQPPASGTYSFAFNQTIPERWMTITAVEYWTISS